MHVLVAKARRDVQRRPLRNILTLLGIILGVAGVVAISFTARSLADAQRLTYAGSRQADLATFTSGISSTTADLVERQPNVAMADTRSITFTRFTSGEGYENLQLIGINSFSEVTLNVFDLIDGRFPEKGEIAFDESTRQLTPVNIGDIVAVHSSPGDPVVYLDVVGITRSPAMLGAGLMNRAVAYVPSATVRDITGQQVDNFLLVRLDDPARGSEAATQISRMLSKRGVVVGTFDIRDPNSFVGARELGTLLLLLTIFSYLGAALSSVLVANTLTAVMGEEVNQIGIIKSLGGRRRQIVATYLLYGSLLGAAGTFIGWLLGLSLGRVITGYLTRLTGLQRPAATVELREVLLALLVGALVTITASILPVHMKSSERVGRLIRSPGIRSESSGAILRLLSAPITRASVAAALGVRNAVRRPARTISTIIVVTVAVAAFIATQALSRSVSGTVDDLYALYGSDGWMLFQEPVSLAFDSTLERNPWVTEAEPWTSAVGAFGSVRTSIWGMPIDQPLYDYQIVDGRWFGQSNPSEAVLTRNLAEAIRARVGDVRDLDVGAIRETVNVVGIVDDSSTYLGSTSTGKVFMSVRDVNRLRSLGDRAELFAFTLTTDDPVVIEQAITDIEEAYRQYRPVTFSAHADQESSRRAISILTLMLNAMVIVVAVVGVSGIANTLLINISERRREFGILRALGAGTPHVLIVLISEGVMLAVFGLLAGTLAGIPLARLLIHITGKELFELNFYLSYYSVTMTCIVAVLAVAAVSAIPGLIAARIRPIQVLRYE